MSGYYKIINSKNYKGLLKNVKQSIFIQELNNKIRLDIGKSTVKSKEILTKCNEYLSAYVNKTENICKILSISPELINSKLSYYKDKSIKEKSVKKECEQLLKNLKSKSTNNRSFLFASGTVAAVSTQDISSGATATKTELSGIFKTNFQTTDDLFIVKTGKYAHNESSGAISNAGATPLESIPEPPPIPDLTDLVLSQLNALGEPTFASLGLGGWTPVGLVQNTLEFLHVSMGLEWWAVIALGTLVIRTCLFPLVIQNQKNSAKMNNCLPQMQQIQLQMTEARQRGDALNTAKYSEEMMRFMKENGLNPLKNLITPMIQAPIFISFFISLRQMANVPVDSLTTGGLFWFTDLTVPDQFYLLPILTSATLWLTIELGTDSVKLSAQNAVLMKYFVRAIPLVILPFTFNFPGAILCYWASNNLISLGQVAFLRIPKVRRYFKIDELVAHNPESLPMKKKGFTEGLKESWANVKITKELEERRRLDEIQFKQAGRGPIQKTYKYNPTKQIKSTTSSSGAAVSAKKRQ